MAKKNPHANWKVISLILAIAILLGFVIFSDSNHNSQDADNKNMSDSENEKHRDHPHHEKERKPDANEVVDDPEYVRGISFSGGGFAAFSSEMGIMQYAHVNANMTVPQMIRKRFDTFSGNSGGSWFLSCLLYSAQFLREHFSKTDNSQYKSYGEWMYSMKGGLKDAFARAIEVGKVTLKEVDWRTFLSDYGLRRYAGELKTKRIDSITDKLVIYASSVINDSNVRKKDIFGGVDAVYSQVYPDASGCPGDACKDISFWPFMITNFKHNKAFGNDVRYSGKIVQHGTFSGDKVLKEKEDLNTVVDTSESSAFNCTATSSAFFGFVDSRNVVKNVNPAVGFVSKFLSFDLFHSHVTNYTVLADLVERGSGPPRLDITKRVTKELDISNRFPMKLTDGAFTDNSSFCHALTASINVHGSDAIYEFITIDGIARFDDRYDFSQQVDMYFGNAPELKNRFSIDLASLQKDQAGDFYRIVDKIGMRGLLRILANVPITTNKVFDPSEMRKRVGKIETGKFGTAMVRVAQYGTRKNPLITSGNSIYGIPAGIKVVLKAVGVQNNINQMLYFTSKEYKDQAQSVPNIIKAIDSNTGVKFTLLNFFNN